MSDNKDVKPLLLHLIDPQQNHDFRDNFMPEIQIDLSKIWFIYSMNQPPKDAALRDRIYLIEVPEYKSSEKSVILSDFVFPKILKELNLNPSCIKIDRDVANYIISRACNNDNNGIRTLEKISREIVNKINFLVNHQDADGKVNGFKISFNFKQKLSYPIELTREMFDKFVEIKEINPSVSMMYT